MRTELERMRYLFSILTLSFLFAGELEVEGNLNVTGDINSPTIDALSGMKPERIYILTVVNNGSDYVVTVPEGKAWRITFTPGSGHAFQINNDIHEHYNVAGEFWMLPNQTLTAWYYEPFLFTIYEYSILGSGTDQGMPYIEP